MYGGMSGTYVLFARRNPVLGLSGALDHIELNPKFGQLSRNHFCGPTGLPSTSHIADRGSSNGPVGVSKARCDLLDRLDPKCALFTNNQSPWLRV